MTIRLGITIVPSKAAQDPLRPDRDRFIDHVSFGPAVPATRPHGVISAREDMHLDVAIRSWDRHPERVPVALHHEDGDTGTE